MKSSGFFLTGFTPGVPMALPGALLILLFWSLPASAQQTGSLKGKIADEKGKPIAGAEVRVMSSRDRSIKEIKTDESGNYSVEVEPDEYSVSFDAEGYQGGTLQALQQVEAGKETRVKTIVLARAKHSSLIRGSVFDPAGGTIAGAQVKLEQVIAAEHKDEHGDEPKKGRKHPKAITRDYVTNNRGEFAFRLPSVRSMYRVTAVLAGYKSDTKVVEVNENETVPLALTLEPLKK
jgi:uncharacterized GH25 family protein